MSYCAVSPLSLTFLWLIEEQNYRDVETLTKVLLPHLLCLWPLLCSGETLLDATNTEWQEERWNGVRQEKWADFTEDRVLKGKETVAWCWRELTLAWRVTALLLCKRVAGTSAYLCIPHPAGLRAPRIWPVLLCSKAPERTCVHLKLIIAGTELLAWFRNDGRMKQTAHL